MANQFGCTGDEDSQGEREMEVSGDESHGESKRFDDSYASPRPPAHPETLASPGSPTTSASTESTGLGTGNSQPLDVVLSRNSHQSDDHNECTRESDDNQSHGERQFCVESPKSPAHPKQLESSRQAQPEEVFVTSHSYDLR